MKSNPIDTIFNAFTMDVVWIFSSLNEVRVLQIFTAGGLWRRVE